MRFVEKMSSLREIYKRLYNLELENNRLRFEIEQLNLRIRVWENKQTKIREEIEFEVRKNMAERAYCIRIESDGKYLISTPKVDNNERI